ncbi:MAG: nucleotidyltransferase domain-containing protein [Nitrososphaeria archaeon]
MTVNESTKEEILEILYREYRPDNISAACIYGSYAAGYARPDSDYDIIVVLKSYMSKIGYKYIREPIDCSILTIEQKMLLDDVKKSGLGEFVSGRFLNIYEPLTGQQLLRNVEVEYKKRVIVEILMEFNGKFQPLLDIVMFPLKYFLFEKLRRRALFYPPALYSYTKTYSEPNRERNLEFSLDGFRRAATELVRENSSISFADDRVWISDVKAFDKIGKLKAAVEETRRDITSYATHLYSGRVGLSIIVDELKSKIKRQNKLKPLDDLTHPSKYLEIPEGNLIVNDKDWIDRVSESLGIEGNITHRSQKVASGGLDKIINVARKVVFEDDGKSYEMIVKKFKDPRNIKWAILALATLTDKRFEFIPMKRLANEYRMNMALKKAGFKTPAVYAVDLDRIQLITKYVSGENLSTILGKEEREEIVEKVGEEIGRLHACGFTLGDAKPDNIIYSDGELYFTDLEQAKSNGDRAWDIAEFLNYSLAFTLNKEIAMRVAYLFCKGYLKYGDRSDIEKIREAKYSLIFKPIVAPNVSKALNSGVEEALQQPRP